MHPSDMMQATMCAYDDDLPLFEALDDTHLSHHRRGLAALTIGRGIDDAYYATTDVLEAVQAMRDDARIMEAGEAGIGDAMLRHILRQPCDHFQRALWFAVADRSFAAAEADLAWLLALLEVRGRLSRLADISGRPIVYQPDPFGELGERPSMVEPVEVVICMDDTPLMSSGGADIEEDWSLGPDPD